MPVSQKTEPGKPLLPEMYQKGVRNCGPSLKVRSEGYRLCSREATGKHSHERSLQSQKKRPPPHHFYVHQVPCLAPLAAGNSLRPRTTAIRCRPRRPEWRPANESTGCGGGKSNQRFASHIAVPSVGLVKKLNKRPAPTPKRLTTSGQMRSRRSVNRQHDEQSERSPLNASTGQCRCEKQATKRSPVSNSTAGYMGESFSYNWRHFRRISQLKTGYCRRPRSPFHIWCNSTPARQIDFSAGIRRCNIQKLPMTRPNKNAIRGITL